ncbi:lipoyl synthase [Candidatus Providencia siddallii]|uniref:Lipoyl synthase n=1 Tax=Candidatus Providencia siddallii TaxID=1715285 RepID=A0ABM9NNG5_9GAMM
MNKLFQIINQNHKSNKNNKYKIKDKNIEQKEILCKPYWLKIKLPLDYSYIKNIKLIMKKNGINSVCEKALCPNISECFNNNTASFMILGTICTRRCQFCNVNHGRPNLPDINEPENLSKTIKEMKLKYVVITSVNRDDLYDGGAQHFANCIKLIRKENLSIKIEILVPDFKKCGELALNILTMNPPDIFNHNIETVPRIYRYVRSGANYNWSLNLLKNFKTLNPNIITKSGIIVGLGETNEEIFNVMNDLYNNGVSMLTVGQYLQPSRYHLPVLRYLNINEFNEIKKKAIDIGFSYVACGPFVRSSYHAELQAKGKEI